MPEAAPAGGLSVERLALPAGVVELRPMADHLLSIHAGPPVRVACRADGRSFEGLQRRGDIDILPAGLTGRWEDETPATVLLLRLAPAVLRRAAEAMAIDPARAALAPEFRARDGAIEHLAWALQAEQEAGSPGGDLYRESLGLALSARLLRRAAVAGGLSQPRHRLPPQRLKRVLAYIEAHLDEGLSLAALAAVAGVSASHFKALFRQATGTPVHRYVVERRVARARTLLLEGKLPMSEIALAAGFAHQSHMARCTRRLLGATPGEIARSRD
jgi:AraC family transcriptional regulator